MLNDFFTDKTKFFQAFKSALTAVVGRNAVKSVSHILIFIYAKTVFTAATFPPRAALLYQRTASV